jgi:hypothetical protein
MHSLEQKLELQSNVYLQISLSIVHHVKHVHHLAIQEVYVHTFSAHFQLRHKSSLVEPSLHFQLEMLSPDLKLVVMVTEPCDKSALPGQRLLSFHSKSHFIQAKCRPGSNQSTVLWNVEHLDYYAALSISHKSTIVFLTDVIIHIQCKVCP